MANDNTDINDIVKKCKILLLDIEGTTTSISFVKDKLFPYALENVKEFLTSGWDTDDVKEAVAALRKLVVEDQENKVEGVVAVPGEDASQDDQIEGLVQSVKWLMSIDRKVGALKLLQGLIWKQGYDKGDIKGHVYDDVVPALELWRAVEDNKVYIYSSGSVQAQKLLFGQSLAGDMLKLIDGHFDTAVGAKQEAKSYTSIVENIGCKPDEILFLTDIAKEAEAARSAGVHAALVTREGNAPLPDDVTTIYPVLSSFAQLAVSNKRKPDQDIVEDEQPAKVPKTDVDSDVKTAAETENDAKMEEESAKTEEVLPKTTEETEKMEVEETPAPVETPAEAKVDETIEKVETVVTEVTDSEVVNTPVCDKEPTVELSDKTEPKVTEKMETESVVEKPDEKTNDNHETKNGGENVPEETTTVITEIEDVTDNKGLNDVDEIIEGLEPIVEEPPSQDMEDLANAGDVLEKECDEILSKVQDVTNLDSIPMKPLLNTIAEETMETENTDTNDIVERILDREDELNNKENGDAVVNNGDVIQEKEKAEVVEQNDKESKEPEIVEAEKVENKEEKVTEETKVEEKESPVDATENGQTESVTNNVEKETSTPETDSTTPQNKTEEKLDEAKSIETEKNGTPTEQIETKTVETQDKVTETDTEAPKEVHMNGKTNGDAIAVNGDSKDELSSRLSMENGKEMNGANGDSAEHKSSKVDVEVADIKVKTVAIDEPRNDPKELPTEA